MTAILRRQMFNDGIPTGLPSNMVVAHKTGNITRIHHDAGIVYATRPYVLVVLVRGIQDQKQSGALIAKISKRVFASVSR
jgi:beta-lactamase class A